MSHRAVQAVIRASRDPGRFSHAELRVLINLAEHHNSGTDRCDPGLSLLQTETGIGRGYLVRIIHGLEERGELVRDDPSSKGGRGKRQSYTITLKSPPGGTVYGRGKGPCLSTVSEGVEDA